MARDAGVDVIVVDHHKCAAALPHRARAGEPQPARRGARAPRTAISPRSASPSCSAPRWSATLRARGFFADRAEPRLLDLLDLVALGTVADVAQLRGPQPRVRRAGAEGDGAAPQHRPRRADRGVAADPRADLHRPRLRARARGSTPAGASARADLGVRLLTTDDPDEARAIAAELDRLNEERRAIEARRAGRRRSAARAGDRAVAVVAGQGWHPGVIGIVAGRLKEKLGRPAIVIAIDEDGVGKGSGRSIPGVDLGAAVLAAKEHGLLVAGGGHAMAAGLTIAADRIAALRRFPRGAAGRRGRARRRRPRAAARRGARARRRHPRAGRGAGGGRPLRHGLARPARRRRAGARRSRPMSSATAMSARSSRATTAAA